MKPGRGAVAAFTVMCVLTGLSVVALIFASLSIAGIGGLPENTGSVGEGIGTVIAALVFAFAAVIAGICSFFLSAAATVVSLALIKKLSGGLCKANKVLLICNCAVLILAAALLIVFIFA